MSVPLPDTFRVGRASVHGVGIHYAVGGEGPPVLLLHGYPQTHLMWHEVAPDLSAGHTVVLADLRGYGDSDKPAPGERDENYSKRAMAADQIGLMASLGFERFAVAGHDRGARVGHRLALDAPEAVTRLAVVDIVATRHVLSTTDEATASAYYHWFFLSAPGGLPERMIGADPELWLRSMTEPLLAGDEFDPAARAEYVRCFADPATIAASCADYRAAKRIDREHDDETWAAGGRVTCPTLVLWGERGFVGRHYDVLDVWRRYALDVRGAALPTGHFVPEGAPERTAAALREFLA